ncbi:hypothetical protein GCM10027612_68750 [Microbispora bryophytorum subsp. camponoti]
MKRTLHDLASLAARMGVGGIFFANGWQKLEAGLNATADQFTALQAPLPHVWAPVTMLTELVGGALLIAGLAVPVIGLLLFAEALAVFVVTAGDSGLPLTGGDIELIVALGAASVLLAVTGAGRISVDHMVVIKRREAEAAGEFAAEAEADAVIAALRPHGPANRARANPRPGPPHPGPLRVSGSRGPPPPPARLARPEHSEHPERLAHLAHPERPNRPNRRSRARQAAGMRAPPPPGRPRTDPARRLRPRRRCARPRPGSGVRGGRTTRPRRAGPRRPPPAERRPCRAGQADPGQTGSGRGRPSRARPDRAAPDRVGSCVGGGVRAPGRAAGTRGSVRRASCR